MSLEIYPASPADAPELTQLFYATFGGDFNRTMFPETADVTEWWEKAFSEWIERSLAGESDDVILKVTEGSEGGAIVAFAKWKRPASADRDRHEEHVVWPPSSDKELCDRFFHGMEAQHALWMGERPHYCMFFLLSFFFSFLFFSSCNTQSCTLVLVLNSCR